MPEVSRFYGLVIRIFYDDHNPPHFPAKHGEHEVLVNINTLAILSIGLVGEGKPPPAAGQDCPAAVTLNRSRVTTW